MIKAEIAASLILLPAHGFIWAFRFLLMKMSLQHAMPPFLIVMHLIEIFFAYDSLGGGSYKIWLNILHF